MQLHSELTQDVHENRMWGHAKPSSKEILKHHSFVRSRHMHRLHARRSAISLGKIVTVVSEQPEAGFRHSRLPKIVSDTSQSSHSSNLQMCGGVEASLAVLEASRLTFVVRHSLT
jgi:hypothetical protein